MQVVLSDKADGDLIGIYSYIAERSPKAADDLLRNIDRKLRNLSAFPFIGRERSNLSPGLRSLVAGNYLIFYTISRDHIVVMRVIDGRMDIDEEFRR